uniref:RRM domain-containing protein n=1 Tax=Kalanchoe fedtschenkoi TaxID=63787 RepID=A0A7N0VF19_KALFE
MATINLHTRNMRLPPEVNKVMYIRNLPFNISSEEMYDIFGKYKAIRQIQIGMNKDMRGISFMVYKDMYDAKTIMDHLSGFNVIKASQYEQQIQQKKEEELTNMQEKYGVSIKL